MVSSEDTSNKGMDVFSDGLVWVQRRNGAWWPGKILGPEELPEGCMISPKSGTPVKLLGRDDGSVDWYNLEKSKRVKAFRCGDYDECIEKAKAAAANASKKVVKYARRENAIIHALELESAHLGNDHPECYSKMDMKDQEMHYEESPNSVHSHGDPEEMEDISSFKDESDSELEFSQSGVSFEDPNHFSAAKEQSAPETRRRTPNDSEDDGTQGVKRMRGLDDLGMGVASSFKRKRTQVAYVNEFLKRKNRRRPLTQVLENTMVSVPIVCEELTSSTGLYFTGASDSKVSGLESLDSKRSLSVFINNRSDSTGVSCETGTLMNGNEQDCNTSLVKSEKQTSDIVGYLENGSSDKLFDVPLIAEENHCAVSPNLACASQNPKYVAGGQSNQSSQVEAVSFGNNELNESGSTSSGAADMDAINQRLEKGGAEWQLKGKRNSRHTWRNKKQDDRSMDVDEESDVYLVEKDQQGLSLGSGQIDGSTFAGCLTPDGSSHVRSKPTSEIQVSEFRGWTRSHREPPHIREPTQRLLPYRQSRFTVNPKYDPSDFCLQNHLVDDSLYDVTVEVQSSSYRPQHVPYISLMSKLSGRPIIGHPLTVEILDDGFCDHLVNRPEFCSSPYGFGPDLEQEMSGLSGATLCEGLSSPGGRMPSKHHTFQSHISPSKSVKSRKNGALSKKMRKLSSLTCLHKEINEDQKPRIEKLKGPAVACVPLNVVFSRINAALTFSRRPALCIIMPNNS